MCIFISSFALAPADVRGWLGPRLLDPQDPQLLDPQTLSFLFWKKRITLVSSQNQDELGA